MGTTRTKREESLHKRRTQILGQIKGADAAPSTPQNMQPNIFNNNGTNNNAPARARETAAVGQLPPSDATHTPPPVPFWVDGESEGEEVTVGADGPPWWSPRHHLC